MNAVPEIELPILRRSQRAEWSALAAMFWLTIRQHLHGKRLIVLLLLYALPCVLAIVLRVIPRPAPAYALEFALIFNLLPHGLAPLTALLYASGIIRDEVEEQTLTYLLLRSMPRWSIYVAKMLATMVICIALVTVSTVALYLTIYLNTPDLWNDVLRHRLPRVIAIFAIAQLAYCALFGMVGLLTRRSLIFGISYIAAVEGVLASLDFVARNLTIVYYVRTLINRSIDLPELMVRATTREWGLSKDALLTIDQCVTRLVVFTIVAVILAAWWFSRREYPVKTPGD
jgi:ABC-2 type transport system permease protein